jgi:hypothetical protein
VVFERLAHGFERPFIELAEFVQTANYLTNLSARIAAR